MYEWGIYDIKPNLFQSYPRLRSNKIGKQRCHNQGKQTISAIIGSYKSICTKMVNREIANREQYKKFAWQLRFYDVIIRNPQALKRIRQYIINNPRNWDKDKIDWQPR